MWREIFYPITSLEPPLVTNAGQYLSAKCQLRVNLTQVMLQQIPQSLIEGVVKRLQICEVDSFTKDMLVKRTGKEAVQELVVVDSLGHDPADELEVT